MTRKLTNVDIVAIRAVRDLESRGIAANTAVLMREMARNGLTLTLQGVSKVRTRLIAHGQLAPTIPLQTARGFGPGGLKERDHENVLINIVLERLTIMRKSSPSWIALVCRQKICNKHCNSKKPLYHTLCSPGFDQMTGRELSDYLRPHKRLFGRQSA